MNKQQMLAKQPFCIWCDTPLDGGGDTTIEHLVPINAGGERGPKALACRECNANRAWRHGEPAGSVRTIVEALLLAEELHGVPDVSVETLIKWERRFEH